ncbi:adenylyl-sulfate kinase [Selenomonas sp.]|uniref:adenylyl-sulfate kinase n=1 Tax=Selenomonas sp. TaxID=2053611 RepID=UPI0025E3C560|nr:adenylyl-sulfate kinase [Selenomonas sp.]MCI6085832.1 adenylyl-sulfate kinase [Selenomonas sp.]MDY3298698.1 adenylyl-sulfate kinase [Selenomonas sp.]MDY4416758.1 adenylyl-sulfate kinase [Selenomonas sp.]
MGEEQKTQAKHGRVYWITGLSGSGKTTIGTALYYQLKEERDNVVILDGDILKLFTTGGYRTEDRLARGKRYAQLTKFLAEQGLWVIICTIAMFDEIRDWNRENIDGYIEVFLDVPLDVLQQRDKKGLYSGYAAGTAVDVPGLDETTEFPKHPDLVLKNDGAMPVADCVQQIRALAPQRLSDFARDTAYWNAYYASRPAVLGAPSSFAKAVVSYLKSYDADAQNSLAGKHVLELGCGNGRDSRYFLAQGCFVTGVDASEVAICSLRSETAQETRATFICDDFVKSQIIFQCQYDCVYSRFTLHAINAAQQRELLKNLRAALKTSGLLFIEARTVHDDLYGKGECVEPDAFRYDGHFRRFLRPENVRAALEAEGFRVLSMQESRGFSQTKDSNPMLLRVIACKAEA